MLFDSDDITAMVSAVGGEEVALFEDTELPVVFNIDRREQLEGGEIVRIGPYAIASAAAVSALGIAAGNDGDTITLLGVDYTVLTIDPDGDGAVTLRLGEVE